MVNNSFQQSLYAGIQPSFLNVIKAKKSFSTRLISKDSLSGLNGIINGAQKMIKLYDQAMPIINQTKPMIDNIKTTFRVAKVFRKMNNGNSLEKAFDNLPDYDDVVNKKEIVKEDIKIANPFYPWYNHIKEVVEEMAKVYLLKPYGYCIGVSKVIELIKIIINENVSNEPIYCIGEIVHNNVVNKWLVSQNVNVIIGDKEKSIDKIKKGIVVFQAHGSDEKIVKKAKDKGLIVYDAICPFVKKGFEIIKNKLALGYDVIYIGIQNHPEAIAALSIDKSIHFISNIFDIKNLNIVNNKIVAINQTTLSINDLNDIYIELKEKYNNIEIVDEICNSTRLRQENLINYPTSTDYIIVIGGKNSNNTKSLYEIAKGKCQNTFLISDINEINDLNINKDKSVLIVSGASTPNELVDEIVEKIEKL